MIGVPSRAEWFGEVQASGQAATVETHRVFGWLVQQHVLPPGASLVIHSKKVVPRSRTPNLAMYVRGRASSSNEGASAPDRLPGMYSAERPDFPAGRSIITAVEETEFWCFNYTMNRNSLPALTPVRLAVGTSVELSAGALLFAMHGSAVQVTGPASFTPEESCVLTATTPFYGFVIAEAKS